MADHPVQFEPCQAVLVRCTLCHVAVPTGSEGAHRQWHDAHVRVHDEILERAERYVPPPRYG